MRCVKTFLKLKGASTSREFSIAQTTQVKKEQPSAALYTVLKSEKNFTEKTA